MPETKEVPMVHLTINHIPVTVPKGTKILQAAQQAHIDIPHLCFHEDQRIKAHCRLCSVEVIGRRRLDTHLYGLHKLGIDFEAQASRYVFTRRASTPCRVAAT